MAQKKRILMRSWQNFCAEFYTFLFFHVLRRFNGSLWKSCKINFISVVWNFAILCNTIEANGLVSMIAIIYWLRLNRAFWEIKQSIWEIYDFQPFIHDELVLWWEFLDVTLFNWFCSLLRCLHEKDASTCCGLNSPHDGQYKERKKERNKQTANLSFDQTNYMVNKAYTPFGILLLFNKRHTAIKQTRISI